MAETVTVEPRWRRLPFTTTGLVAILTVAVADRSWFPQLAYGLPSLEAGRWWTLCHHDRVACAGVVQQCDQPGPVVTDPGQLVAEHPLAAARVQRVALLIEGLVIGAHPRVAEDRHSRKCRRTRRMDRFQHAELRTDL